MVESYVLGLASAEEQLEFEQLSRKHPELTEARLQFEEALELQALSGAQQPPASVENSFNRFLDEQESFKQNEIMESSSETARVVDFRRRSQFAAAAAILLLLATGFFGYEYFQQKQMLSEQTAATKNMQNQLDSMNSRMDAMVQEQNIISDPSTYVVNLTGTKKAPASSASIYWDSTSTNVYLVAKNMPALPTDKQYQLWAIIDGQPKDLGVFDVNDKDVILKMKNVQKADAFAITIEKKGGSPSPSLEEMQSLGSTRLQ